MDVLQVVSSFAPAYSYGGPARSAYQISRNLAARGHDVTVFTTDVYDEATRYDPRRHEVLEEDFEVRRFRNVSNRIAYRANVCFAPEMALALREETAAFDLVHIEEFRSPQAAFAHRYAEKFDVPQVLQPRGTASRDSKHWQKRFFDLVSGNDMMADADRIIATSERESNAYFGTFPDVHRSRIEHVPNGVDTDAYVDLPRKGLFREERGIGSDELLVLFLGRLHEIKGIDLLVRAFADLYGELSGEHGVTLYIAGPDDGALSRLEGLVDELGVTGAVHFPGPLYETEKLSAYTDADLFVLPSRSESFGNVAIEAMACRTPVIVTDRCGVSEWIPPEAGRTVESSPTGIGAAMLEILRDPGKRENLARAGRQLVMEEFGWDSITERVEEVYHRALS